MVENNKIELSIIVPVYKVESYIGNFLVFLLHQGYRDQFEAVFVDDCGYDNSINIIETSLSSTNINFKVVKHCENLGVSAARNSGLDNAIGDYIYWADSDDLLEPDTVEKLFSVIRKYPSQKLFSFNARHKNIGDRDLKEWFWQDGLKEKVSSTYFLQQMYNGKVGAYLWLYLFHKDIFRSIRFDNGSVWEDAIIIPKILSAQREIVCFNDTFIYQYLLRPQSITQSLHPQMDNVVFALNQLENRLYPKKNEELYNDFVYYRTRLTMTLSRECFMRTNNFGRLMKIHKKWSKSIPMVNINTLWNIRKKRSVFFLMTMKHIPSFLYLLYKVKFLK
ncbi:MAG: hypothetical protein DI598_04450 [Pseudopedobacter saltans]|uniref:Glycosyltransferase 2-like domain-containing protein n=1 Tax=Pseudopedobacter saltans TaxID=151895 RepID=A0A2W5F9N9_9SPHI|nr:MAG: hypothetical protein DI598_04450 [Pseudopedobacter saltans]